MNFLVLRAFTQPDGAEWKFNCEMAIRPEYVYEISVFDNIKLDGRDAVCVRWAGPHAAARVITDEDFNSIINTLVAIK